MRTVQTALKALKALTVQRVLMEPTALTAQTVQRHDSEYAVDHAMALMALMERMARTEQTARMEQTAQTVRRVHATAVHDSAERLALTEQTARRADRAMLCPVVTVEPVLCNHHRLMIVGDASSEAVRWHVTDSPMHCLHHHHRRVMRAKQRPDKVVTDLSTLVRD